MNSPTHTHRRSLAALTALAALALGAPWGGVSAHGPAPAPLEVLSWAGGFAGGLGPQPDDAPFPDVIRTSLGLALSLPDGTYRASCPTQWGDIASAPAAATSDRGLVAVTALGEAFVSVDGGCGFAFVDTQGLFISGVTAQLGAVWFWGRVRDAGGALGGGVLLEVTPNGAVIERHRWPDGFWPDDVGAWRSIDGRSQGLLVVGARNTPALWLATRSADGSLAWREGPPLPDTSSTSGASLSRLSVRAATTEGALWLQATEGAARRLWLGLPSAASPDSDPNAFAGGQPLRWLVDVHAPGVEVINGPILQGGRWWAVLDSQRAWFPDPFAANAPEDLTATTFQAVDEVPWTCLRQLEGVTTACTLDVMLHVTEMGTPSDPTTSPITRDIFRFDNLGPPLSGCAAPLAEVSAQCVADWGHYGGESGFVDRPALSIFGDVPSPDPDPDPSSDLSSALDASDVVSEALDTSATADPTADPTAPPPPLTASCGCDLTQRAPRSASTWWLLIAGLLLRFGLRRPTHDDH